MRVQFEIQNMFATVNKTTYGKISTFCPVLCENDLLNSIDKMLVTAEKLEEALNEVRKLDYSIFYREVPFSDPAKGINSDRIMKEILPDIVLMPNAGTKAMMWQEISGVKSDTPARLIFSSTAITGICPQRPRRSLKPRWRRRKIITERYL